MSEQAAEPEVIELPRHGDAAFAGLMDALAPDTDGEAADPAAGAGGEGAPAGEAGGAAGAGTPPATGDALPTAGDGAPAAGDGTVAAPAGTADAAAGGAGAGGDSSGGAAATGPAAAEVAPEFAKLSTALEERTALAYQNAALDEVRKEHENYFSALEKHPRLLIGTQVPAIGKEGMETLRDTEDAREWQDAVKSLLVEEVRSRAAVQMEENSDFLTTVHNSIELFQNNGDLIPGTKEFDKELADKFAELAEPYELRVEGKLQGYSIAVQPIIDHLRSSIVAARAAQATPVAPAQAGAGTPAARSPAPAADPPQAGIKSKAGSGDSAEDFSVLFGTIGLPNLRI